MMFGERRWYAKNDPIMKSNSSRAKCKLFLITKLYPVNIWNESYMYGMPNEPMYTTGAI